MSISTPQTRVSSDQLAAVKRKLRADLVHTVALAVGNGVPIIVRDLVPADFGGIATQGQFTNQVAGASNTYVNAFLVNPALANNQAFGVFAVSSRAAIPTLTQVRFTVGSAQLISQVYLEDAYVTPEATAVLDPPVIFKPLETFNVQFLFSAAIAVNSEVIVITGFVAEPSGRTVTTREVPVSG